MSAPAWIAVLATWVSYMARTVGVCPTPLCNATVTIYREEVFHKRLDHLDEDLKPVMQFSYLTGWRIKSEVLPLRWDVNVDFVAGEVRLNQAL